MKELKLNTIHLGNALIILKSLPSKSVQCIVTSPPYYGLRDYGTGTWIGGLAGCDHRRNTKNSNPDWEIQTRGKVENGVGDEIFKKHCKKCGAVRVDEQIGLEDSPEQYIQKLVEVFLECKRVLRDDGIMWLNIADSYWGGKGRSGSQSQDKAEERDVAGQSLNHKHQQLGGPGVTRPTDQSHDTIKPKDLIGIPWMLAFALRSPVYKCNGCEKEHHAGMWGKFPDGRLICPACNQSAGQTKTDIGWYLRQDNIWHKPNPMPESVTDRCTKSHEYIFLLSKKPKYYYDHEAIKTDVTDATVLRMAQQIENQKGSERVPGKTNGTMKAVGPGRTPRKGIDTHGNQGSSSGIPAMAINGTGVRGHKGYFNQAGELVGGGKANKKSVWTVTTKPFNEAHFATFPEDLILDMIKAGSQGGGVILDPFMGAGTTALVASKLNRNFIGIELNPKYRDIALKRLRDELGLFNTANN